MEMSSLSKYQDTFIIKHEKNLEFTMDYDSGYVSHNPESNLDSSSESLNEKIVNCVPDKPIYLSEDALLEIPEINKCHNLSIEIDKEDYEETRQLFNSPSIESSTILTNSTESHEMNYSGFSGSSDESDIEIPNVNQIIIDNLDIMRSADSGNPRQSNEKCSLQALCSDSNEKSEEYFRGFPSNHMNPTTAFHNITNTLVTNDPKKKLTLIFSKGDKENVYSVKRKYQSMTPDKSMTPEQTATPRKLEHREDEQYISQHKFDEFIKSNEIDKTGPIGHENNHDISSQIKGSVANSLICATLSNAYAQKHVFSLNCSKSKSKSNEEYEKTDSNLLSECLKNFSETCFVNEGMYIEEDIDTGEEVYSTNSQNQDRESIKEESVKDVFLEQGNANNQNISDIKIEIDITEHPLEFSENSLEQHKENIQHYEELEMDSHETSSKQDESIGTVSTVPIKLETAEPTISCVEDVTEGENQTMSIIADVPISVENSTDFQRLMIDYSSNCSGSHTTNLVDKTDIFFEKNTKIDVSCTTNLLNEIDNFGKKTTQIDIPIIPNASNESCTKNSANSNENISITPKKKFKNNMDPNLSPDLFDDEFIEEKAQTSQLPTYIAEEQFINRKDRAILRRAQNNLKGVIPPHSMTVFNISVNEILNRIEHNDEYFWHKAEVNQNDSGSDKNSSLNSNTSIKDDISKSLLINCSIEESKEKKFPSILEYRCHGLYFNRSKVSEEFEDLCVKYSQRYVGAETQSSCTVFESNCSSPMKRKPIKQRWAVKSPGRRLSHLARRRITFSSANLQTGSSFAGSRARQILVDAKKLELLNRRKSPRKTPKKTPGKSPRIKTRTPSSSAKKKLAMRFRKLTGEIEKTVSISSDLSSKRALFQSPECDKNSSLLLPSTSGIAAFSTDPQKPSTKRALFLSPSKKPSRNSPFKRSPFKRLDLGDERKRKRADSEDVHPPKLPRSLSMDIRPSGSEVKPFGRTRSDMSICQTGELSAVHKKKLQWAVYEALRSQSITAAHPQYKLYASILARVTRRFLPNLGGASRPEGSTSDRMLRLARHHVYAVLKGKSVDEIYNEHLKNRAKSAKPQGYVALEQYNVDRKEPLRNSSVLNKTVEGSSQRKLCKPNVASESKIERIRKVINFGDDNS